MTSTARARSEIFDRLTRDDEHVYEEDLVKEMGNTDSDKGTFATFCDGTIEIEGLGATPVINVGGVPVPPLFLGWVTKQDGGWFGQIYNRAEMAAFKGFCGPLIAGAPTKGYGNKLSVDALTALLSPLVPESGKQIQGPPAFKERFAAYSAYLDKVAGALTEENILAAKVEQLERCSRGEPSIYTLAYQLQARRHAAPGPILDEPCSQRSVPDHPRSAPRLHGQEPHDR